MEKQLAYTMKPPIRHMFDARKYYGDFSTRQFEIKDSKHQPAYTLTSKKIQILGNDVGGKNKIRIFTI